MQGTQSRARTATKICLGTSLASLAVLAVLVNAAFYSALVDYWPMVQLLGPAVMVVAVLMAASFIAGLLLHGLVVVSGRRGATTRTRVVDAQLDGRRAA